MTPEPVRMFRRTHPLYFLHPKRRQNFGHNATLPERQQHLSRNTVTAPSPPSPASEQFSSLHSYLFNPSTYSVSDVTFTRRTRGHHLGTLRIVTFSFNFLVVQFVTCYFRTPRINFFSFHPAGLKSHVFDTFIALLSSRIICKTDLQHKAIAVGSPFGFVYLFRLQKFES